MKGREGKTSSQIVGLGEDGCGWGTRGGRCKEGPAPPSPVTLLPLSQVIVDDRIVCQRPLNQTNYIISNHPLPAGAGPGATTVPFYDCKV